MGGMALVRRYRVLDRDYPHALRELSSPPDPLCVRGELLPAPGVAIVGTRYPSTQAVTYACELAGRLARSGVTVWSGGAVGIDAAAHRGALEAGGLSVAVVGTGLDHCYPDQHAALYEEIVLTGGALVSPFEPAQNATNFTFPQRNGVLAALTQATVVVQAPIKSGARSTARFARRLGRPLFVLPASPWDLSSAGNLAELELGARPLADERRLFELLGVPPPSFPAPATLVPHVRASMTPRFLPPLSLPPLSLPPLSLPPLSLPPLSLPPPLGDLSPACEAVFGSTGNTPCHPDDLCAKTGLSAALVQEALLTLTLQAVLVEGPAGWFRRISTRNH